MWVSSLEWRTGTVRGGCSASDVVGSKMVRAR